MVQSKLTSVYSSHWRSIIYKLTSVYLSNWQSSITGVVGEFCCHFGCFPVNFNERSTREWEQLYTMKTVK